MKIRLDAVIKNLSVANAAIKNTASPIAKDGWYPAFSASGQDVWLPDYRFDHRGIVVSAVGARCGKAFKADGKWNICANTHALSVDESIADRDYCWYILNNETWWIKGGTVQPFVKVKDSLKREHLFPSLDEQSRIVQVLDQVSHILDMRQKELLFLDNMIKARFVEMFGDPVSNPKGLPLCELSKLGLLERGRSKHRPRNAPELLGGPYPLVQTGEVSSAGLYITSYSQTYSKLGLQQSRMWKAGTLCVTIAANIAQTAILAFDACFPDSVVGFTTNGQMEPIYLHYWFTFFQKILEDQAPQVAQKNINLEILSNLQVIVPEVEQQKEFISFVTQVDKSKGAVQKALDEAQLLFDSLMQQYFG